MDGDAELLTNVIEQLLVLGFGSGSNVDDLGKRTRREEWLKETTERQQ